MSKCERCGSNEGINYSMTKNGKTTREVLCYNCAVGIPAYADVAEMELHIEDVSEILIDLNPFNFGASTARPVKSEPVCDRCGTTESAFVSTAYAGCPGCYVKFKHVLAQAINSSQKGVRHVGKRPKRYGENMINIEYNRLLEELEKAQKERDYELAQILGEKMRELNGGRK